MHPVLRLLWYIPYNLILNRIISGRWGPASGTLLSAPQNVNFIAVNFVAPPPILENENCVTSQCPEFYAEDALMLSQVIYLGLLWLGLIVLLNPGVTIGNFTKKYLKPCWWLIINSMWIWVVIPHHLETALYYPVISVASGVLGRPLGEGTKERMWGTAEEMSNQGVQVGAEGNFTGAWRGAKLSLSKLRMVDAGTFSNVGAGTV
ncbi:hypothetical protein DSO57_1015226 [Entomophthora muscae]|uniref:Uncharacterized protein n=1 Tax=Entomophthora muscae TaxID=34485 RepID=A0ACC2TS68_9FUNG|nr:hypothetical protein DSO57_1015226 [Entomophthora muscae]